MAKKTFEQSMEQLEKIVEELESGDLPLEKALKKFEEGMKHSKNCSEILDDTDRKITMILQKPDGTIKEQPFTE